MQQYFLICMVDAYDILLPPDKNMYRG